MASEQHLKALMVSNPPSDFPVVVERNDWLVVRDRPDLGAGDLVFANRTRTQYLVVEVKRKEDKSGPTACTARRKGHKKVNQQLQKYMKAWAQKYPGTLVYGQTNFGGVLGPRVGPCQVYKDWQSPVVCTQGGGDDSYGPVQVGGSSSSSVGVELLTAGALIAGAAWWFGSRNRDK